MLDLIENFILSTHKVIENQPKPYGLFHIIFVVVSLAVIVTVCYLTRNHGDKAFRTVLLSVGLVLLVSEVYKQLYFYYAVGESSYPWFVFPFQLCSVPMYLSIVVGCMRKSKTRDALCEYLASIGFLGGIMAYAEPSGMLNVYWFALIHSCLWHGLLIFIALYILFTGNACRRIRDYRPALAVLAGVLTVATVLNILFRSRPDFNMCYISPFYNTPLAVFSSFDTAFQNLLGRYPGRILSILIYIFALGLGGFVVYGCSYLATHRKNSVIKEECP